MILLLLTRINILLTTKAESTHSSSQPLKHYSKQSFFSLQRIPNSKLNHRPESMQITPILNTGERENFHTLLTSLHTTQKESWNAGVRFTHSTNF